MNRIISGVVVMLVLVGQVSAEPVYDADAVAAEAAAHGADSQGKPFWKQETVAERDARMHWWRQDRFGMFIHWGLYSLLAGEYKGERVKGVGEWILHNATIPIAEYRELKEQWNPVKYDPEEWVLAAKQAGMKYIVITAKHCEGFTLWPTAVDDWGVQATPYKKDLLKPLEDACRKHGLKFGVYYSHNWDWYHPGGVITGKSKPWDDAQKGDYETYFKTWAVPQFKELMTHFDQLDVLWFDVGYGKIGPKHEKVYLDLMKQHQPDIIINDRLAPPKGTFRGDYVTPEGHLPGHALAQDWETCMTMDGSWGYVKHPPRAHLKGDRFIKQLIECVSKGGNYLLNIGPTGRGLIPEHQLRILKEVGEWMSINSESIYGCGVSPIHPTGWGMSTAKKTAEGEQIYLHITDWPENNKLQIRGVMTDPKINYVSSGKSCSYTKQDDGITIQLGKPPQGVSPIVVHMSFDGDAQIEPYRVIPTDPKRIHLGPLDAQIHATSNSSHVKTPSVSNQGLSRWNDERALIVWNVEIKESGTYDLQMLGQFTDAGIVLATVNGLPFQCAVNPQKREYNFGEVNVSQAGIYSIQVKLKNTHWQKSHMLESMHLIKR